MQKKPFGTKERAINDITNMLNQYSGTKRGKLIASWLSNYSKLIKQEETFNPKYLKRYRRGEVIMVDFGFRLGNEEGGPHYAIVLDKKNSIQSGVITVLPLSSKKEHTVLNSHTLDLGDEIYQKLNAKAQIAFSNSIVDIKIDPPVTTVGQKFTISVKIDETEMESIQRQIDSMKKGSIALLSQITSISKMRIIKPTRTTDALSGIRLSDNSLNAIDTRIKELYIGK